MQDNISDALKSADELIEGYDRSAVTREVLEKLGKYIGSELSYKYYIYKGSIFSFGKRYSNPMDLGPIGLFKKTAKKSLLSKLSLKEEIEELTEAIRTVHVDLLKQTGFSVKVRGNTISATKSAPTQQDLNTAMKFMQLLGYREKQRFGKIHTNLNIAYTHTSENQTGFINYAPGEKAVRGNPYPDDGEIFLNAGD